MPEGVRYAGLVLSGMNHVTDSLWNTMLPRLQGSRILVMGSPEKMAVKIHIDHLIDSVARHCAALERIEFRWDNDTLR